MLWEAGDSLKKCQIRLPNRTDLEHLRPFQVWLAFQTFIAQLRG